ncbi:MAG: tripartite tricarboxylate transporter substrate binding protein [Proteobacteria bacterium]|nr:tripartite tricarboxylate transporter substrate binding protein [Pseudomonadota bacterium]
MSRRALRRLLALLTACALSGSAAAQTVWPDRSVQLIVPFSAGGGVDVIARPFAEIWREMLHQPIVVVPRDGAAGTIGTAAVAAAKPDGYTLAFTPNGPITVQPHVIPTLPYKPDDLVPLCQVFAVQYVLAVRPDNPYRTFGDLIAAAKARPGKLMYGFGGIATAPHLAISQLTIAAEIDMLGVPFRGDPQVVVALRGGEIDSAMLNVGAAKAQGFRPLATFADARQQEIADTPTVKELGYPVVSSAFGGLFAPKGLPPDSAKKIEATCQSVVADERFQRAVRQASQEPVYRDAAHFGQMLAADYAIKGEIVKRAGIKAP